MKRSFLLLAALPLIFAITGAAPLAASAVPGWAVGTFTGFGGSNRVNVELVIERNGAVTMRTWRGGETLESRGAFHNNRIDFSRESYTVSRRGSGIRIARVSNPRDTVDLRRSSSPISPSGSVPSWAVGTFSGRNSRGVPVELRISSNGSAVMYSWAGGKQQRSSGTYRNGMLRFSGASYSVQQKGANIRITLAGDRSSYADLFRSAGSGGSGGSGGFGGSGGSGGWGGSGGSGGFGGSGGSIGSSVPSWAVGTFRGHGGSNNADIELVISADANVVMRSWRPDGKQFESKGRYRDGKLMFNEDSYYMAKRGSHVRISRVSNPRDYVDLDRWN
ncbi:MAG: hypothetical protein WHZ52_14930 [Armatimonadota bacterium]